MGKRIEMESPKISDLQDMRQDAITAINQIKNVIKERVIYLDNLKIKHQEFDNKVNEKQCKINNAIRDIEELKETLSKQTISPKDVEIMNRESTQLNTTKDELQ